MGGKSRKSGGVSERLIKRIKQGDFNKPKKSDGDKKGNEGFGFRIPKNSPKEPDNS